MPNNIIHKEKIGHRPPTWNNPEEMKQDFMAYIEHCTFTISYDGEKEKKELRPQPLLATITGFCNFKDITRETYYCYSHKDGYSDTIKKIEQAIEQIAVERLVNAKNPAGAIFYMKNKLGWVDKKEISTNTEHTVNVNSMSREEIEAQIIARLENKSTQ